MSSRRTFAVLCVLVLLVFAGVLLCAKSGAGLNAAASGVQTTPAKVLRADGGDPMPNPLPVPRPWSV